MVSKTSILVSLTAVLGVLMLSSAPALAVGVPPTIDSENATTAAPSNETLEAQINPNGQETSYAFEYSTEATGEVLEGSITSISGPGPLPSGATDQTASVTTGEVLAPDTKYYYRVAAENATPPASIGPVQSFTTLTVPPVITQAPSSSGVGRTSVLLSGMVDPENTVVFYRFLYGLSTSYGSSTPVTEGGSGIVPEQVSQQIEGLVPGTTYHYALVVSNPAGGETSSDGTFSTTSATPPVASTGSTENLTVTGARVTGTVNPDSLSTTYAFQIGTTTAYGGELPGVAGAGGELVSVEVTFSNLQPATVYHYRLVATNQDGTSYGQDQTFTTSAVPGTLTVPVAPTLLALPAIAFPTETGTVSKPKPKKTTKPKKRKNGKAKGKGRAHGKAGKKTKRKKR